ncbi:MAG: HAMP domain-containing protein, partial [Gammaproteobacteria bacterium]|nr:HAMP domain-containing protein [Gammaproteobacteria bacterium]
MTIKTKMSATAAVVTLLLAFFGAFLMTELNAYGRLAESRYLAAEIGTHVFELRNHEMNFLARRENAYVDRFNATHAEVIAHLDELEGLLEQASISTAVVAQVRDETEAYRRSFGRVVELQRKIGLHPKDALYGGLRSAVHDAEKVFSEKGDYELSTHMLMLRRAEKDFMLRRNAKYVDKFSASFDTMQAALQVRSTADTGFERAIASMDTYKTRFLALVEAEREMGLGRDNGAMGALNRAVTTIESVLEKFETGLGQRVEAEASLIDRLLIGSVGIVVLVVAGWLSWLGWNVSHRASHIAHSMREIAQGDGDLTRRMDESGRDEFADLARAFNQFAAKIHDMLKHIAGLATVLSETTSKVSGAASSTDDSMRKLRGNTQTVVVATEEMSATARDVASSASQVAESSQEADAVAIQGRQTVEQNIRSISTFASEFGEAASTITGLRAETENIGGILDVIRGIAEQTNLLALNAAIEAARAGEQGRGFAVVADEVRTLAHRSQQSTNEIQDLISRLQEQAESAVGKIQHGQSRITDTVAQASEAGHALARITDAIGTINGMTTQIATAAEEQSAVVADISR